MADNDRQTEGKIFDAATEVFIEKGMDGTRMQDIADRAGINKSLLHYYYRTKERLFNAVFEKVARQMISRFAPVFDEHLSLEEKIRFFFNEHIELLRSNPRLPGFILNEVNRHPERFRVLMENINVAGVWETLERQHHDEFVKYQISREAFPQLMTSIASLTIFPFAARGLISVILEKWGIGFEDYIEKRKTFAADLMVRAITQAPHWEGSPPTAP